MQNMREKLKRKLSMKDKDRMRIANALISYPNADEL